ncbi:hypothetical protein CHLNCDRAFT_136326 [Chlorella variabilis]|uniref:Chalcone isomerase domain-containing protein n=1 Tax=Chlorella variabilis TaxID=554065 RepID=E1ZK45_CHLVA|nr:hypothetical protein CHLNCDRAFT_136326 [Chlorella variabilis]EFN53632.1 hypothetical protein CHLNCDRAFT_136326 [Chlorella variabilis]|eukprot:XP_005845734.1 hypothetical protein CHLNCDRAFT_136326 [Chlorella variabilis]
MADIIKETVTGVAFPRKQQFWHGGELTCLGAGARVKKVAMMTAKVYAVSMYVDADSAARADSQEKRPESEAAVLRALQNGAFTKVLQMHLVRSITGKQFADALDESLRPMMRWAMHAEGAWACAAVGGDEAVMDDFCGFFEAKKMDKDAEICLLWHADGPLDVCLRPATDKTPYASAQPGLSITSPRLGRAMWELYLSPKTPSPDARKAWLAAVPKLAA